MGDRAHRRWACAAFCSLGVLLAPGAFAASGSDHELTVVPVVGGSSDVGLGGGYIASYATLAPDREPFVYRVRNAGFLSFKSGGDHLEVPYADEYLRLELPHVVPKRFRLEFRVSFTRERNLKYYGLGNAAGIPPGTSPTLPHYEYGWTHPSIRVEAQYRLTRVFALVYGLGYTQNWLEIPTDSLLAEDMRSGPDRVKELLRGTEPHAVALASYGVGYDDRDDEVSPHRGQYHTVGVDLAPGGFGMFPLAFGRVNVTLRGYFSPTRRIVLALRVIGDALFGEPPFYELARLDDTYAVGGANGVRGVRAQGYYGKIKALGNFELRSDLFEFRAFSKTNGLGITAFFDAGRVWLDYRSDPELDGTGLGLKYGIGGGLRWTAGESFVLRADAAWSKDADPIGLYLAAGQLF